MLSIKEIEHFIQTDVKALEHNTATVFHHGAIHMGTVVSDAVKIAKADALVAVKEASPEIQTAVQLAVESIEKAVLAAIEARLA